MTTFERVCDIISKTLSIKKDEIMTDSLLVDLSSDSIQLFELLLAFEKAYECKVTYNEVVDLHTVGDVVAFVEKQVTCNFV